MAFGSLLRASASARERYGRTKYAYSRWKLGFRGNDLNLPEDYDGGNTAHGAGNVEVQLCADLPEMFDPDQMSDADEESGKENSAKEPNSPPNKRQKKAASTSDPEVVIVDTPPAAARKFTPDTEVVIIDDTPPPAAAASTSDPEVVIIDDTPPPAATRKSTPTAARRPFFGHRSTTKRIYHDCGVWHTYRPGIGFRQSTGSTFTRKQDVITIRALQLAKDKATLAVNQLYHEGGSLHNQGYDADLPIVMDVIHGAEAYQELDWQVLLCPVKAPKYDPVRQMTCSGHKFTESLCIHKNKCPTYNAHKEIKTEYLPGNDLGGRAFLTLCARGICRDGCLKLQKTEAEAIAPLFHILADFFFEIGGGVRFISMLGTSMGWEELAKNLDPRKFLEFIPMQYHLSRTTYLRGAEDKYYKQAVSMSFSYRAMCECIDAPDLYEKLAESPIFIMLVPDPQDPSSVEARKKTALSSRKIKGPIRNYLEKKKNSFLGTKKKRGDNNADEDGIPHGLGDDEASSYMFNWEDHACNRPKHKDWHYRNSKSNDVVVLKSVQCGTSMYKGNLMDLGPHQWCANCFTDHYGWFQPDSDAYKKGQDAYKRAQELAKLEMTWWQCTHCNEVRQGHYEMLTTCLSRKCKGDFPQKSKRQQHTCKKSLRFQQTLKALTRSDGSIKKTLFSSQVRFAWHGNDEAGSKPIKSTIYVDTDADAEEKKAGKAKLKCPGYPRDGNMKSVHICKGKNRARNGKPCLTCERNAMITGRIQDTRVKCEGLRGRSCSQFAINKKKRPFLCQTCKKKYDEIQRYEASSIHEATKARGLLKKPPS